MDEEKIKEIFEKTNHEFKEGLEKEFFLGNIRIDYISKKGDITIGIEAKGSRSNLYSTIGQLFFFRKIFSHLYLLAPLNFIKNLTKIIAGTFLFTEIGFLTIDKGGVIEIKKPNINTYYFQPVVKLKEQRKIQKLQVVNENDIEIIKKFRNRVFTVADMLKEFNITRENAYRRISRLKKAGVVKELSTGNNPKTFEIIKYTDKPIFTT